MLEEAVDECGYTGKVKFGLDPASSEFVCDDGTYDLGFKTGSSNTFLAQELHKLYSTLTSKYPIVLLEDPFAEDDWDSWTEFQKGCKIELVGDDLLVTNKDRIRMAKDRSACNSLLLKLNQIGTVSEAIDA